MNVPDVASDSIALIEPRVPGAHRCHRPLAQKAPKKAPGEWLLECVAGADDDRWPRWTTRNHAVPVREDSSRFGDAARAQTPGANPDVRTDPVHLSVNTLEVRALNAFGLPVGVADLVLYDALLAADCTLGWHGCSKGAYL